MTESLGNDKENRRMTKKGGISEKYGNNREIRE